jgi:putative FmdB family regulatory protein
VPTYEYACSSCGTRIDVFQRFNEEPLTECGVCGGSLRKVFHPAGILFKGAGFYKTDSRTSRTAAAAKSSGGESDSSKAGEKTSTDEKKATASKDTSPASSTSKEKSA